MSLIDDIIAINTIDDAKLTYESDVKVISETVAKFKHVTEQFGNYNPGVAVAMTPFILAAQDARPDYFHAVTGGRNLVQVIIDRLKKDGQVIAAGAATLLNNLYLSTEQAQPFFKLRYDAASPLGFSVSTFGTYVPYTFSEEDREKIRDLGNVGTDKIKPTLFINEARVSYVDPIKPYAPMHIDYFDLHYFNALVAYMCLMEAKNNMLVAPPKFTQGMGIPTPVGESAIYLVPKQTVVPDYMKDLNINEKSLTDNKEMFETMRTNLAKYYDIDALTTFLKENLPSNSTMPLSES